MKLKYKIKKIIRNWWIPYLQEDLKSFDKMIKSLCEEWASDDTHIEKLCFKYGFTENDVWGDSYYTPGIQEKVDLLCSLIPEDKIKDPN